MPPTLDFLAAGASAQYRPIAEKFSETVSVTDWGVDHAAIQAALDEAPLGSTIVFPPGVYQTTGLLMTRRLSWRFDPGAALYGVGLKTDPRSRFWTSGSTRRAPPAAACISTASSSAWPSTAGATNSMRKRPSTSRARTGSTSP